MKLTITVANKEDIDWSKSQLLVSIAHGYDFYVKSDGTHDDTSFSGFVFLCAKHGPYTEGYKNDSWAKSSFTLFKGTILIEQ